MNEPASGFVLSPDGTHVVGTANDRIKFWNFRTGEHVATLPGHVDEVQRIVFRPDGAWMVTGGADRAVRFWDCREPGGWQVEAPERIAFSGDGKTVATADVSIQLWDALDGRKTRELKGHTDRVNGLAFSRDNKLIVSAGQDSTARVWEVATGKQLAVLKGHPSAVESVAFNRDGTRVATSGHDKSVRVWNWRTGEQLVRADGDASFSGFPGRPRKGPDYAHRVTWSPDDKWILSLYDCEESGPYWDRRPAGYIRMFDAETGEKVATLKGHKWAVVSVAFSPDGRWIVSGGKDATIRVWDVKSRKEVRVIDGHRGPVHDVAFSSDSDRILSAGADGTVRIWDRLSGEELKVFGEPIKTNQSGFSHIAARCRVAVTAAGDQFRAKRGRRIDAWSTRDTERVRVLQGPKRPMAVNHDGKVVASVSGNSVYLWDTTTGRRLRALEGHHSPIRCLAFNKDGTRLVSASKNRRVKLWDTTTGEEVAEFTTQTAYLDRVGFHPNGKSVVAENAFDRRVAWDIQSGAAAATTDWPHDALDEPYRSADQRWLLIPRGSYVLVADVQFINDAQEQAYLQATTAPSPLWHQRQATAAERNSDWYAASFHRAWLLKLDPASAAARDAVQRSRKKLFAALRDRTIVPPIVDEVLERSR